MGKNVLSFKNLAELRGVVRYLLKIENIKYDFFNASSVRKKLKCGKSKEEAFNWFADKSKWNIKYNKHNDMIDAILLGISVVGNITCLS